MINGTAGLFEWNQEGDRYYARIAIRVPDVVPWSPHTHGRPALYPAHVELTLADGAIVNVEDFPAGFRSIDPGTETPGDGGLALIINGTSAFCRGAAWTPRISLLSMCPSL